MRLGINRPMARVTESDLYPPVKAFLQELGYTVKAEIKDADVMGVRADAPPLIVELKAGFSLILLQQGIARQAITDHVYVAVPRWKGKAGWRMFKGNIALCKRLGLGVLSVDLASGEVQVHHEPAPFQPRKNKRRTHMLLKEFHDREGDPNIGGVRAGGRVTAYRQGAEKCRAHLAAHGPCKGSVVARATGVTRATTIMRDNHYGWFEKQATGVYALAQPARD